MNKRYILVVFGLEVVYHLVDLKVLADNMLVGLEINEEQLVDGVAVLGDGDDDIFAVVRDVRAGAVGGVGSVEVDEDVIGLRSSNLVIEPGV